MNFGSMFCNAESTAVKWALLYVDENSLDNSQDEIFQKLNGIVLIIHIRATINCIILIIVAKITKWYHRNSQFVPHII